MASACPDITRAPPVYMELPDGMDMTIVDDALNASENGYCCEGRTDDSTYPLCDNVAFENGCFIAESSYNPGELYETEWCVKQGDDPYCVISGSYLDDSTIEICEEITYTTVDVRGHTALPAHIGNTLVGSGVFIMSPDPVYRLQERILETTSVEYRTLASICTVADTQNCIEQEITVCQESGVTSELWRNVADGATSCLYVCEQQGWSQNNCQVMCEGFVCETHTAYFGDSCQIDPLCEESVVQELYTAVSGPGSVVDSRVLPGPSFPMSEYCDESFVVDGTRYCSLSSFMNGYPSLLAYDEDPSSLDHAFALEYLDFSVLANDVALFTQDVQTVTETVCRSVTVETSQTYCIPNDHVVNIQGNTLVCTDPSLTNPSATPQDHGDYWCPEGFVYDAILGFCMNAITEAICDFVPAGETPQCANIFGTDVYGLYNAGCVVSNAIDPPNTYRDTCCYAATFNNNDIYQEVGVTVY